MPEKACSFCKRENVDPPALGSKISPEIETEIREICALAVRGRPHDIARIIELQTDYTKAFKKLADQERKIAREELNPFG